MEDQKPLETTETTNPMPPDTETTQTAEATVDTTEQGTTSSTEERWMARVAELEAELNNVREQMLRKAADFDNFRKRLEQQKLQHMEQANITAVMRFLPVFDDLKRSLDAAVKLQVDPSFMEGVRMVADKFNDVLAQYDVTRIDEVMVPFDVEVHEALMRQKHEDPTVQPNTVTLILDPGYRMGDKVIRHAKVMVSE